MKRFMLTLAVLATPVLACAGDGDLDSFWDAFLWFVRSLIASAGGYWG